MSKKTTLLFMFLILGFISKAQIKAYEYKSELFNEAKIIEIIDAAKKSGTQDWEVQMLKERLYKRLAKQKQDFISPYQRNTNPNSTMATCLGCANVGFDQGNLTGWTLKSADINSVNLPCNTCPGGTSAITALTTASNSGTTWAAGVDNCSGQTVLAPFSSNVNSVCLNNNTAGGKMESMEYKLNITLTNNIFTYSYLAVLQDGGTSHTASQQPYFLTQVLDGSNNVIPCTYLLQTGGPSATGWTTSTACGGIYKGWNTVTLDMSAYVGQCVTIDFLVSDCNQGGHYGYAYVDASCDSEPTNNTVTICPGSTQLCGQAGFLTYSWTGPVTGNTQCLNTSTPGNYVLTTTGQCPAPTRYYTVTISPTPTVNFTDTVTPCNNTVPFTDHSTISGGATISGWSWNFGEPASSTNTSSVQNPTHTYAGAGTYNVVLTCTSSVGCTASATVPVTISAGPTATFTPTTVCPGNPTAFSTTSPGSSYTWNFGEPSSGVNNTSNAQNPSHTYAASGSYVVNLSVAGTGTCVAVATQTVVVSPAPTLTFTATHPCEGTSVIFTNNTANQASFSGWTWDFGDGSTGTGAVPPAHPYPAGCYIVVLTGTTSVGCPGTYSTTVYTHPNPGINFTAFEVCIGDSADFLDSSYVINPPCLNDQITSWSWNFGDGTGAHTVTTMPDTLKYLYATCGAYNISLTVSTSNTCTNTATLTGDTIFCAPVVTAPLNFSVCPAAATPVQIFNTTCANGGTPTTFWFQSLGTVNNTGAPASFLNPGGNDQVPSYNAVAQNLSCSLLSDTIFAVAVSGVGCVGNAVFYIENVFPTPIVNHMDSVKVCSNGQAVVPPFTVCPATSTIAWTNNTTSIGLAAGGSGNVTSPFTGLNATTQAVYALITETPSANGCVGPDSTFIIAVSPLPTITVTPQGPYCPGDNVPSPVINMPNNTILTWTVSNAANIGMTSPGTGIPAPYTAPANASLVNQVGVITYTPTLNGCVGTPTVGTITIKPTPVIQHINDVAYCPGVLTSQINYACLPTGMGTPNYNWQISTSPFNVGLTPVTASGDSLPAFTTAVNNTGVAQMATVTLGASLNNCPSSFANFVVTINPTPIPSFTYAPVCEGQAMSFTDLSTPNSGAISVNSWAWDMNNDGVYNDATTQNPSYSITPAGQDPISVFVSTNSVPSCTAAVTQTVTVNPNPIVDFVADTLSGCPTLPVVFRDTSTVAAPSTITSYAWSFGNGNTSSIKDPVKQYYTNSSATTVKSYTVSLTVIATGGCTATKTKASYINVSPTPIADFSWGPTDADIDDPAITFVNQAIGAGTYTPTLTYGPNGVQYYLGDLYTTVPSSNNVTLTYSPVDNTSFTHVYDYYQPETYTVTQWVINSLGCKDSVKKEVVILPNFTFYIPNAFSPNGDGTNEGFKGTGIGIKEGTYNLWVFDRWGNMIFYSDDLEKAWDGHMKGNTDRPVLQEDVYVWKVNFHDFNGKKHDFHGTVTLLK